jgi:hypothetical protein
MHMLSAWEQTAVFNPADPTQLKIERYAANPGGYTTYYFNRVKPGGSLAGATLRGPLTDGIAQGMGLVIGGTLVAFLAGLGLKMLGKGAAGKKLSLSGLGGYRKRRRR